MRTIRDEDAPGVTFDEATRHHNWKGGRTIDARGYILVRVGKDHPLADVRGYAYEHRLIAFAKHARLPKRGEHVHHIDGNRQNNQWDNVEILSAREHGFKHRRTARDLRLPHEANGSVACACGCGGTLERFDREGRRRIYLHGHRSPAVSAIENYLRTNGPSGRKQIASALGKKIHTVAVVLSKMRAKGRVEPGPRGRWRIL